MLSAARRAALAVLLGLAALACAPGVAAAGEYDVSVCRHADGSIAPADGWQFTIADDFFHNDIAVDTCSLGGSLDLQLREGTQHGRLTGVTYAGASVSVAATPPAATAFSRAVVWWAFRSSPTAAGGGSEQIAGSIGGLPQTTCAWGSEGTSPCSARGVIAGPPLSEANRTMLELGGSTAPLALLVSCSSAPLACPTAPGDTPYAQLRAWRLQVTLADNSPPAFDAQPALPPAFTGASMPVAVSATDAGSGVHTAQAIVDGAPVGTPRVIDDASGRCVKHPDGTFGQMVPCKLALSSAIVGLDLAGVPNGLHAIAVRIADAAGNIADSAASAVKIDNPPPPVPLSAIPLDNPLRGRGRVHNGSGSATSGSLSAGLRVLRLRPGARTARPCGFAMEPARSSRAGSWARMGGPSRARS